MWVDCASSKSYPPILDPINAVEAERSNAGFCAVHVDMAWRGLTVFSRVVPRRSVMGIVIWSKVPALDRGEKNITNE